MSKPCRVLFDEYYPHMNTMESHVVETKNTLRYLVIKSFCLNPKRYTLTVVRWDEKSRVPYPDSLDHPVFYQEVEDRDTCDRYYDKLCFDLESYVTPYVYRRKEL